MKDIKKELFQAELLLSCSVSYACQIYQMLNAYIFSVSSLQLAHNGNQKMQKILAVPSVNQ